MCICREISLKWHILLNVPLLCTFSPLKKTTYNVVHLILKRKQQRLNESWFVDIPHMKSDVCFDLCNQASKLQDNSYFTMQLHVLILLILVHCF